MLDYARQQLEENGDWRAVLEAYRHQQETLPPDLEGWCPRLEEVPGVKPERLARIHGKLIAYGLLKFQLTGRETGVVYRLTGPAKALLDGKAFGEDGEERRLAG